MKDLMSRYRFTWSKHCMRVSNLLIRSTVPDSDLYVQTDVLLKGYVNRIQELEFELQQLQHARIPSDMSSKPPSSTSSRSMGESTAGPGFGVAGIDGDIYLRAGIRHLA